MDKLTVEQLDNGWIRVECGKEFVEWNAENFLKHMEWVGKEIRTALELDKFKQHLKSIEWIMIDGYASEVCPVCNKPKMEYLSWEKEFIDGEHATDCWLAKALEGIK